MSANDTLLPTDGGSNLFGTFWRFNVPTWRQSGTFLFDFVPERVLPVPVGHVLAPQRAHWWLGGHILMRFCARSLLFGCSGHVLVAQRAHWWSVGHTLISFCSIRRVSVAPGARLGTPVCPFSARRAQSCGFLFLRRIKYRLKLLI